jgi:serine/threonine protein kinase
MQTMDKTVISCIHVGQKVFLNYRDSDGKIHHVRGNKEEINVNFLPDGVVIEESEIYPQYEEWITPINNKVIKDVHIKTFKPHHIGYASGLKRTMIDEIRTYELLNKHRVSGVPKYYGCIVENGLIKGFGISKLSTTLEGLDKLVLHQHASSILTTLSSIVDSLHDIGVVHGDINPTNIMFDDEINTYLVDFDSSGPDMTKMGSLGWMRDGYCKSNEDDKHALNMINNYIRTKSI